jgi:hypothetical protein
MKNLTEAIEDVINGKNPECLTITQREELTAAHIKDLGSDAYSAIEWIATDKIITDKIIEALLEKNLADRNVLLKEIGEILMKEAIRSSEKEIENALENVLQEKQTAYNEEHGLISEAARELQLMLSDYNRQRI